jgi:hypothetical protein
MGNTGEHVAHAAWTPDSQFFVASTVDESVKQPWAHPIWVYSRAGNRIFALWNFGAIALADFSLKGS